MHEERITELAERVATLGPGAVERELQRFIREARRHNATPLLVAILADRTQPEVVRQRAFGRVHAELDQFRRSALRTVSTEHAA